MDRAGWWCVAVALPMFSVAMSNVSVGLIVTVYTVLLPVVDSRKLTMSRLAAAVPGALVGRGDQSVNVLQGSVLSAVHINVAICRSLPSLPAPDYQPVPAINAY